MIIQNKETKKLYLVYSFWKTKECGYLIMDDSYDNYDYFDSINIMGCDECIEIDKYYSKYWYTATNMTEGIVKEWWKEEMFIEVLFDSSAPASDDYLFMKYKTKIDAEYYKLYAWQEKFAELYPECYQVSNIKEFGKDLGDNWIMCPKCSEAYEVKNDQGYIDCQNKTCKIRFNNPYAKKFPKGQNDETNTN